MRKVLTLVNSDKKPVIWVTVMASLVLGALIWELVGLSFNQAIMAPLLGADQHPGTLPRLYEYLLALGALLFVSLQAIINIGVVTGSMPTKGMSLPFISYGGSNLMVTFIFVGLIINVFRRWDNPKTLQPREI